MGIKEVRTKILLAVLLLSNNTFDSVNLSKENLHIFDLVDNKKFRKKLLELAKDNKISITDEKPTIVTVKMTIQGYGELILDFPVFRFMQEKWDGKWRILSYEIPESKRELRDKLRRKVAGWGLGPWHRSFWLTPHPVINELKDVFSKKEEEGYIQAFEADHVFGRQTILIEKVWSISRLEAKYRALFKNWHEILSKDTPEDVRIKQIIKTYVDVIKIDPGLPSELIGDKWIGLEALKIFREIRDIILKKKQS